MPKPRVAYLFSRYPVVSQTFCDSEMLALEERGFELEIGSLNPPPRSFRHARLDRLKAEIHYPPPPDLRDELAKDPEYKAMLGDLVADHDERYGTSYKAKIRARNAWYFAKVFRRLGVQHVHIHFANRATHSALFLKRLGFSVVGTAQDVDAGMLWVNQPALPSAELPFGGIKDSGLGYKEGVQEAMKSFTNIKTYSLPWI